MARRSIRSQGREAGILIFLVALGISYAILRWLTVHWWVLLPLAAIVGYGVYRRWKRRQAWWDAFRRSGITAIDGMSGRMFEERLRLHFNDQGWHLQLTPTSGDFGADLVGTDPTGQRVVVQAKRYQGSVGVHAIQEVLGGKAHYGATRALVITNSGFTANARTLAAQAGVELWDRTRLIQELS
ncbi:restriction endonuclease [Sulfobacillus harzensis]|uniref:Restriction endonuclease n=1 Tax=Sulfobacillus harzensis TaxID=2729629 RepID=A0A7Y0L878_9FIRM|nr:restriction endonuclease [Sulfobacillus harzensis]NMP25015.1 restriction endonuclease [Sulfobacillus harzensis]